MVIRSDIGQAATEVRQKLEQAGFGIFALTQARPSLDDVYLAATGRTLLDAELAAAETSSKKK